MNLETVRLEDVCLSISDGDHQAPPKVNTGIPFVTISNIDSSNKFNFSDVMYVSRNYYDNLDTKRKPQKNDILYSVVGSFGIPVYIDSDERFVFQRHIAILRPDVAKIVPKFLYYIMCGREFYAQADTVAVGVAQRTIALSALRKMKVSVPPKIVQNKIADILASYDNLIEINNKRIKILEKMAENLYKEWFVRFRFPGHEKAEFVDGVPKGWKVCKLKDIIKFNPKYDFKQQYSYINIPMAALSTSGMSIDKSQITIEEKSSGTHFVNGDVLFAKITPCLENGKTGLVNCLNDDEVGTGSTEFIVMHGVKVDSFFTYCIARDELFRKQAINSMNGADGRQRADLAFIKKIKWLLPSDELLVRFKRFTDSVIKQIEMFNKQNQNLIKQRDYLLPRLMSGKLQV